MPGDSKLSALTTGTQAAFVYGEQGGASRKYAGGLVGYVLNVKDFGAVGDGSANDTAAIQAAFDAAFGSVISPNGNNNPQNNIPVFFPGGNYRVVSPAAINITAINNNAGSAQLVVNSTTDLKTGYIVEISGVNPSYVNGSWGIRVDGPTTLTLYSGANTLGPLAYVSAFSSGGTGAIKTAALHLRWVTSAHISGVGRTATRIFNDGSSGGGGHVISANGLSYSCIEKIKFDATGADGICFDYNWDQASLGGGNTVGSQSVTFSECFFVGNSGNSVCADGLRMGKAGGQCSETLILNCYFFFCSTGLSARNQNACDNCIVGGNIAFCGTGILVPSAGGGVIPLISGVSFQFQTSFDIDIQGTPTGGDGYTICGCRCESPNATTFLGASGGASFAISGCIHHALAGGAFVAGINGGSVSITGCTSANGTITGSHGTVFIEERSGFPAAVLDAFGGSSATPYLRHSRASYTTNQTLKRVKSGLHIDNLGATGNILITLPNLSDTDADHTFGVTYGFYVAVAHQLKIDNVNQTIRDAGNLSVATGSGGVNGSIASSTVGDYVLLTSLGYPNGWVVIAKNGTGWVVT